MRPGSLALFLLLLPALSFAGIVPVTEQPVSAVTYGEAIGTQGFPVSAAAGNDLLVAWTDTGARAGIWETVVTAPNTLTPNPARKLWSGSAASLQMCWTGNNYLLIWQVGPQAIMTALLDRSGAFMGEPRFVIPSGAFVSLQSIAWDGQRALVVAAGTNVTTVMLFDASGSLVSGPTQLIAKYSSSTAVVSTGAAFVVFYVPYDSLAILATRVDDTGAILDSPPHFVIEPQHTNYNAFGTAFDGSRIAIAYVDSQNGVVTLHRAFIDPTSFAVQPLDSYPAATIRDVRLVWNGAQFVASWIEDGPAADILKTLAYRDTETAAPVLAATFPLVPTFLSSVWTGRDLWFTVDAGRGDIDALLTDMHGAPLGNPFYVSTAVTAQTVAAVAPGLDVWGEATQDGVAVELFASTADSFGRSSGQRVQISTSGNVAPDPPIVVKSGSTYFVVWNELTQTTSTGMMRRIRSDGTFIDPQPVAIGGAAYAAAVSGSTVVIVYRWTNALALARFDTNGNPLDPITLPFNGAWPRIASNGDEFLLAWNVGSDWWQFPSANMLDVMAARLDATGQPIDVTPFTVTATATDEIIAGIASNGRDFMVSWTSPTASGSARDLQLVLQRVDGNGTLDGAPRLFASGLSGTPIAMDAATGGGYWVAYTGGTFEAPMLWVAKTDASGAPLDNGVIANVPSVDLPATITPAIIGVGDAAVVGYSRFDDTLQVPRVFTSKVVVGVAHAHAARR